MLHFCSLDSLVLPVVAVVDDTSVLPKGAVRSDPVRLDGIHDHSIRVNASKGSRDKSRVLSGQPGIDANARDVQRVCACYRADTVDPGVERRKASPGHLLAARQLRSGERVSKKQADLPDEGGDANDLSNRV